jgi:hypothetical protein
MLFQNRTARIEEMASGSFNIDTFSYRHQLPLSNGYTAFSTGTMFAVGPSSFTEGYSFYDYSYGLLGFPDTSTLSVSLTTYIGNVVKYLSTDALYGRTFNYTFSTTTVFEQSAASPGNYPLIINLPSIELDKVTLYGTTTLLDLLKQRSHNVIVQFDYNLALNKSSEPFNFNWVSTLGYFGPFNTNTGIGRRELTTRINTNNTYTTVASRMQFDTANGNELVSQASTFNTRIVTLKNSGSDSAPDYSIYVPGNYNYSFTFYPLYSNISLSPA